MNPIRYLRDGYRWLVDPYGLLDEAFGRRGLTFRIRLPVLGNVLMTGDERLIGEIVRHKHLDGGKAVAALRAILGSRSLIMLEGEAHAARRRLIAPSFSGESLVAYDEPTVRVTREVFDSLPAGRTFRIYSVVQRLGLKSIVAAMFGDENPVAAEAERVVEDFLNSFHNPLILFLEPLRLDVGRLSPWGRALAHRRALVELIRGQIRACRNSPDEKTILVRLISAGGDALSEEDLVEEVMALLLFGHDTAAAAMAWALVHICQQPGLTERLRDEAENADLGPSLSLDRLPLLRACIEESLRLCPVVVHLARTATADLTLAEHTIRRGEKVIPCSYLAQHNPRVFPDPHAFRPERFLEPDRYEHSYFPFGFGGRTCVGKQFALRQMLLVLATAVRHFDLELAPGYRVRPARHLVLIVPRDGGLMRKRHPSVRYTPADSSPRRYA